MIQVKYCPYTLVPINYSRDDFRLNAKTTNPLREGALLRLEWIQKQAKAPTLLVGYADLFPWPEFGDKPLLEQFEMFKQREISNIFSQAVALAKHDADLRHRRVNGFAGLSPVSSHFTAVNPASLSTGDMRQIAMDGFQSVKLKFDTNIVEAVRVIHELVMSTSLRLRLDFNCSLNLELFSVFVNNLSLAARARIEFVEDPMPWNLEHWTQAHQLLPLALDFEYEKVNFRNFQLSAPFKVIVIKPARQNVDNILKEAFRLACKVVITSSMDHPVGVTHAALIAAELKKHHPNTVLDCGLMTLDLYQKTEFHQLIKYSGPAIFSTVGHGIGFDGLLQKLNWKKI